MKTTATYRLNTKLLKSLYRVLKIPSAELIETTTIPNSTWYNIMARPDTMSIQQLLLVANNLHIPVRSLFSTDETDIIGKRDDYVCEPYLLCYYDKTALRQLVETRADATWSKAAAAVDMTYSRLRDSLTAVTRTPVMRFLTVCNVFGVDPFSILIDPNPPAGKRKRKAVPRSFVEKTQEDIAELHQQLSSLTSAIDDLKKKYETLLQSHEQLARRVSVNIENINSSYIGIAAEK